ncbi:hypothetical protein FAIPA1_200053 [Frankia sp. AiPs1]
MSSTLFHGSSRGSWKTTARRSGTSSSPPASESRPARARRRVLLPEPLRPSNATNSPGAASRSMPRSTRRGPNDRVRPRVTKPAAASVGVVPDTLWPETVVAVSVVAVDVGVAGDVAACVAAVSVVVADCRVDPAVCVFSVPAANVGPSCREFG